MDGIWWMWIETLKSLPSPTFSCFDVLHVCLQKSAKRKLSWLFLILMKFVWYLLHNFRKSSINPPLSNKPPPPLISLPSLLSPHSRDGLLFYQLEVQIWFRSSAAWPPTFLFLSFSTLYSSSLLRTDTIVFSKLKKPPNQPPPPTPTPTPAHLPPQMGLK